MKISRGSIHHSIKDDFLVLIKSLLKINYCNSASKIILKSTSSCVSQFFGSKEAILFPYARTSLYAILKSYNIKKGSEILMTPFNIYPMIDVIKSLDLEPIFIDINLTDFGPNYDELEYFLSKRPACFLLTYLFGSVPNIELILNMCNKYFLVLFYF